ncbi:MAG: mucoidy inhibitor MuiA family protein [Chitinophagaceae bacterium]|nr:mucoidy inhibitor MuiA family protein [Chitinophagaceae bacterium]
MYTKTTCLSILLLFSLFVNAGNEPLKVPSSLKTVTVYRNGAEMIHNANASLQQGANELIIEGISNAVDINSIQINCPSAVTLIGVEFSSNYLVTPQENQRIKQLKDSANNISDEIAKVRGQITTINELLDVLKANKDIKGSQTGLSVAELMKLMDYYKAKSNELQQELKQQNEKQKKWNELLTKINNQVAEEEKKNTKNEGRINLQLSVAVSGKYDFVVSYITPNAYWTPYYDIRVDDIKTPLKVIYKSKITQTTGLDWKKVKLSLSTSVPNQWGNAPVMNTWFLAYINPVNVMEQSLAGKVAGVQFRGNSSLDEVVVVGYGTNSNTTGTMVEEKAPIYIVNGAEMTKQEFSKINKIAIKKMDVLKDNAATAIYGSRASGGAIIVTLKEGLGDYVTVSDNELNVTFDIDIPFDIPTNGKAQTAVLKEYAVDANYKFYSVPRLDKDAYLLADISEWEKLNLLPGDANIIFEGTYVGKSFIDPNSTLDTLNLTLGRDKRVVVKKEKLTDYSSVKFLGANKLQKFTYEITVKNNKKDAVEILLKDQYPLSTNKDIESELTDDGGASINKETGVLSWQLKLAPGETKKIRFGYNVKYAKDRQVNLN